jgi:integrase
VAKLKLTKTIIENARPADRDYDLRDTEVPGLICKVTPKGNKVFMLAYRNTYGQRRKPRIGRFGEITIDQARRKARELLLEVHNGGDPSREKMEARQAPTMADLCDRYMREWAEPRKKPSSVKSDRRLIDKRIKPALGSAKVAAITDNDISNLMHDLRATPIEANRTRALLSKMLGLAEVWGYRKKGSNPCRGVEKYAERGSTRLLSDDEYIRIHNALDDAEATGSEHPSVVLAVRLHFAFAARMSEILNLQWDWIDWDAGVVRWPDSKTGGMVKPLTSEVRDLLSAAPRADDCPYVCPGIRDPKKPLSAATYAKAWGRILKRAKVPHVGTHGIRHKSATDIANSGTPLKVGMRLTGHKTVAMFMRYVHTEDDPVRAAAENLSVRRKAIREGRKAEVVPLHARSA